MHIFKHRLCSRRMVRRSAPDHPAEDHGHGGHRHGRHGHGGRRGRLLDYGELRTVVLALIAEKPRHGYELIKAIEERSAGSYIPSPGVIYPTLTLLEELGHATVVEGGGKKLYTITPDGEAWLAEHRAAANAALARIDGVGADKSAGRTPELVRATENLKLALRLRLERGKVGEAEIQAIAAALDAAALAIERS